MLKIELLNLWFRARHGLYEEEKVLGGDFKLDVELYYLPRTIPRHIHETIDYSEVYALIQRHMAKPEPLLETLVITIGDDILRSFALAEEVNISIRKINPPIIGFTGSMSVSYRQRRGGISGKDKDNSIDK